MQTIKEMLQAGATQEEAELAIMLYTLLKPGLKRLNPEGRIQTQWGDKTPLGLLRTIKGLLEGR
jgi:hypothetical protein